MNSPQICVATHAIPAPISAAQMAHLKPIYEAVADFYAKGGCKWEEKRTSTWNGNNQTNTVNRVSNDWGYLARIGFSAAGPNTAPNSYYSYTYHNVRGLDGLVPHYPAITALQPDEIATIEVYARFIAAFNKGYRAVFGKAGNRTLKAIRGRAAYQKCLTRIAYLRGTCNLNEEGIVLALPFVWDVERCNINTGSGEKYMECFALAYYDTFPHLTTPPTPWS